MAKTVYNPFDQYEIKSEKDIRNKRDLEAWTKENPRVVPLPSGALPVTSGNPFAPTGVAPFGHKKSSESWEKGKHYFEANPGNEASKNLAQQLGYDTTPDYLTKNLGEDNPLPWQKYLATDAVAMGDEFANRGEDYFSQNLMRGVDDSASLMGGAKSPMESAIARKYQSEYGNKVAGMKAAGAVETKDRAMKEMSRASDVYGKQQQIRMQNFKEQYEYQERRRQIYNEWLKAQKAAESSFLSSVLGGLGTLVGAGVGFLAGGPPGAVLGAGIGNAGGGSLGGAATTKSIPMG